MSVPRLAGLALVLALAACSAPAAATSANREAVTRSGTGIEVTDRFSLTGDYRIDWTATHPSGPAVACVAGGFLQPTLMPLFNVVVKPGGSESGRTHAYGLRSTDYHLEMHANCDWVVTLTPI